MTTLHYVEPNRPLRAACGKNAGKRGTSIPDRVTCLSCTRTVLFERAQRRPHRKWYAGWNVPGQLPKQEPKEFERWQDAFEFLRGELMTTFLAHADPETKIVSEDRMMDVAPAAQTMATTPHERPFLFYYHGMHWWVADLPEDP